MIADVRYFLVGGSFFLALLVILAVVYNRRARKARGGTWEGLLSRLIFVDRHGVEQIALDAIDSHGRRREDEHAKELEAVEIWRLVGGLEGVEALQHNSRIFVDMATYLQTWYPEAVATAEELRISAREIEWHVASLQAGDKNENLEAWFRAYAQNAAATYYLMTRQLLSLYENGNAQLLGDLQRAI
jgi:hypothetical protein